jgi:hypothetical protein
MNQRASVCICTDAPEEDAAFDAWLEQWKEKMAFISDDYGCGCCVHLFDVEGPSEAIAALPKKIRATTDWSEKEVR